MRAKKGRPTKRGLGSEYTASADEPTTPPQPVSCVSPAAPTARSSTRYSLRPVVRETLALPLPLRANASDDAPPPSRRQTSLLPACVDEMGPATAALAARCARTTTPRRAVTTARLERAQLSERDAFVLSLIDDRLSLQSLLDVAGMPERELLTIVDRLVRLDLVVLS